jgi:hypothetical protein
LSPCGVEVVQKHSAQACGSYFYELSAGLRPDTFFKF